MFSEGAIPIIDQICRVVVPLAGVAAWLLGWVLHGLGGPTRPFLRFALFAAAIALGEGLTEAVGAIEAGRPWSQLADDLLWIVAPVMVLVGLLATGRRRAAGIFLAGIPVPWILIFVTYVVDLAQGVRWSVAWTFGLLAAGAVPMAIGVALAVIGDRVPASDPTSKPGRPGSRRAGSLTRHLLGDSAYGGQLGLPPEIVALGVWVLIRVTLGGPPVLALAAALVGLALAAEAELRWMPRPVLAALEAYHQIGLTEMAQFRATAGRAAPSRPGGWTEWLAIAPPRPELVPVRIEILGSLGRWDEAASLLASFEPATPEQVNRKAALAADHAWRRGGPAEFSSIRDTLAAIGPTGDPARSHAEGQLAWLESEVRLAALDPTWKQPLMDYRALVPTAAGVHARVMRARAWKQIVIPMGMVILGIAVAADVPFWPQVVIPMGLVVLVPSVVDALRSSRS